MCVCVYVDNRQFQLWVSQKSQRVEVGLIALGCLFDSLQHIEDDVLLIFYMDVNGI